MSNDAFWADLPRKRVGAGALITDAEGRVLMVEPNYKDHWEIPGGLVDEGETAVEACRRECREELGLELEIGRLLVLDHQTEAGERGDSIMFVYDGGRINDPAAIQLQADELRSFRFVEEGELDALTTARLANRARAALRALATGQVLELLKGEPRPTS